MGWNSSSLAGKQWRKISFTISTGSVLNGYALDSVSQETSLAFSAARTMEFIGTAGGIWN
jgi:hypothetical protein